MTKPTLRHLMILAAVAGGLLFFNLGATRLWDVDEAIFAQAAWEMMDRGDWVVPYFNGQILPDKPPVMYWLMICGYQVFGENEFAARFWPAVFGIGCVGLTYWLGRLLFSARAALWAGLILASCINFGLIARAATPDSELVFFCLLSLIVFVLGTRPDPVEGTAGGDLGLWRERHLRRPSWRTWAAAYAVMGMAVMVKGPVGVVLPTASLGLFLLCHRSKFFAPAGTVKLSEPRVAEAAWRTWLRWIAATFSPLFILRTIWSMRPLTALAAVLLVAGPWYVWVGVRTDGEWLSGFFGVHNVGRFMNAMDNHRGPVVYYLPAILVGLFPWSVFAIPAVLEMSRRMREGHAWRAGYLLLLSWALVWVGFFSLASTKLHNYVIPAYPAFALCLGGFIDVWLARPDSVRRAWLRAALGILGIVGVATLIVVPIVSGKLLGGEPYLALIGLPAVCGAAVALWFLERQQMSRVAITVLVTAAAFSLSLLGGAAVRVDRYQNSEMFVERMRQQTNLPEATIGSYGYFRPSLVFYAKQPIAKLANMAAVRQFGLESTKPVFLFTIDPHYEELKRQAAADWTVVAASQRFLKPGNVVLLVRNPAGAHSDRRESVEQAHHKTPRQSR